LLGGERARTAAVGVVNVPEQGQRSEKGRPGPQEAWVRAKAPKKNTAEAGGTRPRGLLFRPFRRQFPDMAVFRETPPADYLRKQP
jgi:hypothetical protein